MPESKEHFQDLERHPGWSVLDKTSGNTSVNQTLGKFASFKLKLKQKLKHGYSHPLLYWWTHQSGAEVRTTRSVPNTQVLTCILDETKCRCFYSLSPPVYVAASMAMWININFDRSVSAHPQGRVSVGELSGPAFRIYLCADSEFSVFCVFSVLEYTERTELVSCFLTLTLYWAICCSQLPSPHRFAISSYYSGTFSELSGCCVNAHHEEPHRNHLMFLDAIKSFNCDIIAATECSSNYGGGKCKKLHFPKRMQSFRWPTFSFPLLPHWHQRSDVFTAGAP